jgi:hypothetical protein
MLGLSMKSILTYVTLFLLSISANASGWVWMKSYPWVYTDIGQEWAYITSSGTPWARSGSTWEKKSSVYFSNLGWVWMKDQNFGYSNQSESWVYVSDHDGDKTFLFSSKNNNWSSWNNYFTTHLDISKEDAPNDHSGKQDFSILLNYPNLNSVSFALPDWLSHLDNFSPKDETNFDKVTSLQLMLFSSNSSLYNDFPALTGIKNLKSLSLSGTPNFNDLSPLSDLTDLTSLTLASGYGYKDLSPLSDLTNLTSLSLPSSSFLYDLSPLAGLANLNSLTLNETSGDTFDMSPIAALPNLRFLKTGLGHTRTQLAPLANVSNLSLEIHIDEVNASALTDLTNLISLEVASGKLRDISALSNLTNLTNLSLMVNSIEDISPLFSLTKLDTLVIRGSPWFSLSENELSQLQTRLPRTLISIQ